MAIGDFHLRVNVDIDCCKVEPDFSLLRRHRQDEGRIRDPEIVRLGNGSMEKYRLSVNMLPKPVLSATSDYYIGYANFEKKT